MDPDAPPPSMLELGLVLGAGIGHVATELAVSPRAAYVYNVTACLFFLGYLFWRGRAPGMLRAWGMRADNFRSALLAQALFAVPVAAGIVVWGRFHGMLPLPRTFWMIVALYPLWGIAQQFALQNLLGRNLTMWIARAVPHALVTALLFSAAHFPNYSLMLLTLGGGFFFTLLYRRRPNLWAVGILHGFLGALAYYLVLGEDPGAALSVLLRGCG